MHTPKRLPCDYRSMFWHGAAASPTQVEASAADAAENTATDGTAEADSGCTIELRPLATH